jgi:hypothetical protein
MTEEWTSLTRLRIALVAGLALDTAALCVSWALLQAIGPLEGMAELWLNIICLIAIAHYIHTMLLPILFRYPFSIRIFSPIEALSSIFLIAVAAMIVPFFGVMSFLLLGNLGIVFLAMASGTGFALPTWGNFVIGHLLLMIDGASVGAIVGLFLYGIRVRDAEESLASPDSLPRARSDILGGAAAGFLAICGGFIAGSLGLFRQPIAVTNWWGDAAGPPQIGSAIVIGTLALMPHLLMVCLDQFNMRQSHTNLQADVS